MQNIGTDIMNAYFAGRQLKQRKDAEASEQEFKRQQLEAQVNEFNQRLQQQKAEFDATQKFHQAQFNLQQTLARPAIAEAMTKGLMGATRVDQPGGDYQLQSDIPGMGQVVAPSPEAYAKRMTTLAQPEVDIAGAKAGAVAKATAPFEEAKLKQQVEGQKQIEEMKESQRQLSDAENTRRTLAAAHIAGQYRLAAANVAGNAKNKVDPANLENVASGITSGLYTVEQLPTLGVPGPERMQLLQQLKNQGIAPLSNLQKKTLQDASGLSVLFNRMQELTDKLSATSASGAVVQGIKSIASPEIRALEQEIEGTLGNIARNIGGEKGMLSNPDIIRAKGLVPSKYYNKETNLKRINELKQIINQRANSYLVGFSADQRNTIFHNFDIPASAMDSAKKKRTMIQLDDGKMVPDTPENRVQYGLGGD